MTDEKYVFIQDSKEKKITARSARNMRTHNGKGGSVKFPSDFLSRKELKAMSGECIKYASLKKPMTYEEFKALPDDLKVQYITSIRTKFGAPDKYIAEMLGCSCRTLAMILVDIKCNLGKGSGNSKRKWEQQKFTAWRLGADMEASVAPVVESCEPVEAGNCDETVCECGCECHVNEPVEVHVEPKTYIIPNNGTMNFIGNVDDILTTVSKLLGSANVSMTVSWHCIEKTEVCESEVV